MKPTLNVKSILPLVSLMCYPLLVLIVVGWFVIPDLKSYIKEIVDYGLSFIILSICIAFVPNRNLKKGFAILFVFFLAMLVFTKLSFFYHYGVKISASALFVVFETNTSEANDFLSNYFNLFVIFLFLLLTLPLCFIYKYAKQKNPKAFYLRLKGVKWAMVALLFMGFSIVCLIWKFQNVNGVLLALNSYNDYKAYKMSIKDNLAKFSSDALKVTSFSDSPQTNIVIIGESTSNWHMQLYGYERKTNPLLTEIKDGLLVFDSVIAPNVHTILALDKILTLSDYQHPQKKENGSIVQLANQAGFETYWLSNQRPVGINESVATLIGNAAKNSYYVNSEDYMDAIYDEKILPVLDSILVQDHKKKLIFIQLIGTHIDYRKRYPKQYEYFKDDKVTSHFATEKNILTINAYDNAVRYNDFIVRSIIDKARKVDSIGYVLYFSDHGDEVFDTMDFLGHNEYQATRPMYEVPFVLWLSEDYKRKHPNFKNPESFIHNPYNLEDFIHSFSDLNAIKFNGYDSEKSIFSPNFKKRTRWIKENIDYDHQ